MRTPGQPSTNPPACRRPSRAPGGPGAFTLVELLVTMSIASLLIGLVVAGVRGLNSSTNRRSAVGTLMGVFDQARTLAVSDGRATYVAFVSAPRGGSQNTADVTPRMWGQAYALFEDPVLQDGSTAANFLPQQRSTWLYLPTGIAFKCDNSNDNAPASLTTTPPVAGDPQFGVLKSGGGTVLMQLPYLKFDPTGQIVNAMGQILDPSDATDQKKLRVLLFQGTASGAGTELMTKRTAGTTGANVKFAFDQITLKPVTGRAAYTQDPVYNLTALN